MNTPTVFMFSGQGSQYYHMGKELFEGNAVFQKWMQSLDQMVHDLTGTSVLRLLYDKNSRIGDPFTRTLYTHPAIFMIEYALTRVLTESGVEPDYVLGASLGEFASACLAGVMNLEDTLKAVVRQAEALEKHCPPGSMMAILHSPDIFYNTPLLRDRTEFAGQNFDSHFVVSGSHDSLQRIENFLQKQAISYQLLPVSQAFHSASIDPAEAVYKDFLGQHMLQQPKIPVISCLKADELAEFHQGHLWDVVRKPIAFQKTVQALERRKEFLYIDIGPSGTLANFAKYNLDNNSGSRVFPILTPFVGHSLQNLEHMLSFVKKTEIFIHNNNENISNKENTMITWVFPGQGSQKKGMGEILFDEFKDLTARADAILGYSIKELCLEDPQKQLNLTQYTQPALFIVNALSYLKKVEDTGQKPDFVAGHSLGEYNALFASGGIDFETGVKLVKKRGELMGQASGGTMAAVIKLPEDRLLAVFKDHGLTGADVANYNSPSQVVISGLKEDIDKASKLLKDEGGVCIPLQVSAAFHSRYMKPAQDEFEKFLQEITFKELQIPLISNLTARPYRQSEIAANLAGQISNPVKWTESIRYLMGKGEMEFEEIGPGNVLTKLVTTIQKEAEPLTVAEEVYQTPEQKEVREEQEENKSGPERPNTPSSAHKANPADITPESLGDEAFKQEYHLKYAYLTGAMVRGIASKELVIKMGKAGLMGYLGTGGMNLADIEQNIQHIQQELTDSQAYGMNLLANVHDPRQEDDVVELYLKYGIRNVEAAAYMQITPSLVRYRLKGLNKGADGTIVAENRIMAKVSRPEVSQAFLSPAPELIVKKLLDQGKVSQEQAELAKQVPMATAICVESDSGGHTDQGIMIVLLPTIIRQRDELVRKYGYARNVWVGAAGGIGTPEAAAAAFMLGADFILTGSINQCSAEAGISDPAKDILQGINVQDTAYAPAADMFEMGAMVQVVRKGVFFPARANKLYDLYRMYDSWDEIDTKTRKQIEEKYFMRTFDDIWAGTKEFFDKAQPQEVEKAERNPKHKMALVFRWYLWNTMQLALRGETDRKVDFQIHCGPALGAFNQWVRGTSLEDWRNRHVDELAEKLMQATAESLNQSIGKLTGTDQGTI